MDIRIAKSKRSIFEAFVKLRAKKELRKITVKELCERAMINKSTFYAYYEDIFDLADKIETEVVENIVREIPSHHKTVSEPEIFCRYLFVAMAENSQIINAVFSGTSRSNLVDKISKALKKLVFELNPQYAENRRFRVILDYLIYGGYYAFEENTKNGDVEDSGVVDDISVILRHMTKLISDEYQGKH